MFRGWVVLCPWNDIYDSTSLHLLGFHQGQGVPPLQSHPETPEHRSKSCEQRKSVSFSKCLFLCQVANCDIIPTTHHFGDDTSQIKCSPSILTLGHQQEIPRLSVSQRQSGWETLRKLWTANYELNPQDIPKWLSKAAWSRNCWVWLFFSFFLCLVLVLLLLQGWDRHKARCMFVHLPRSTWSQLTSQLSICL